VKVLLDEMMPAGLTEFLPGHQLSTAKRAGFTGLDNGELISRAIAAGYTVLVTADRGLPAQRNVAASGICVVLVPGSRLAEIAPFAREIDRAIREASAGSVVRIARRDSAE
jgi:hypothetical protein